MKTLVILATVTILLWSAASVTADGNCRVSFLRDGQALAKFTVRSPADVKCEDLTSAQGISDMLTDLDNQIFAQQSPKTPPTAMHGFAGVKLEYDFTNFVVGDKGQIVEENHALRMIHPDFLFPFAKIFRFVAWNRSESRSEGIVFEAADLNFRLKWDELEVTDPQSRDDVLSTSGNYLIIINIRRHCTIAAKFTSLPDQLNKFNIWEQASKAQPDALFYTRHTRQGISDSRDYTVSLSAWDKIAAAIDSSARFQPDESVKGKFIMRTTMLDQAIELFEEFVKLSELNPKP